MGSLTTLLQDVGVTTGVSWMDTVQMKHQPKDWQLPTMKGYWNTERFGDFSDPGTGKTFPMQLHAVTFAALGNKAVMVMPPTLCNQFHDELLDFFIGIENHLTIHVFNEKKAKREALIAKWQVSGWPDILIMSYNAFREYADPRRVITRSVKVADRPRPMKVKNKNPYPDLLKRAGYACLYADEAHALKNPGSQIHKAFWQYVGESEGEYSLYLATGSPSGNTPEDTYGIIRLKTPQIYVSKRAFDRQHLIMDENEQFATIIGYNDLDTLHKNLFINSIRVSSEVFRTTAEPQIIEVKVKLDPAHKRLYDQVVKERYLELPEGIIDITSDNKMRQVAKQVIAVPEMYTDKKITNNLRAAVSNITDTIDLSTRKVVIFANYKVTVAGLAKQYAAYNPAVINGASSDKNAQRLKFLNDDTCRVAVINWMSGGTGLNLQSVCHYLIFVEIPTVPKDAWQAIARADRTGQTSQVITYFLRVMRTISGGHIKTLLKKDAINNQVVKDKKNLLEDLMIGQ